MTVKYVKSDIVDRPYFTAGKAYEVVDNPDKIGPEVIRDDDVQDCVIVYDPDSVANFTCARLDNKDTWKWCDKEGNEL